MSGAGSRKVCFEDLNEEMFLEVQNNKGVYYNVYLDTLLMVSIRVFKSLLSRENPEIPKSLRLTERARPGWILELNLSGI